MKLPDFLSSTQKSRGKLIKATFIIIFLLLILLILPSSDQEDEGKMEKKVLVEDSNPVNSKREFEELIKELRLPVIEKKDKSKRRKASVVSKEPFGEKLLEEKEKLKLEMEMFQIKMKRLEMKAKEMEIITRLKELEKKMKALEKERSKKIIAFELKKNFGNKGDFLQMEKKRKEIPAGTFLDAIIENEVISSGEKVPVKAFADKNLYNIYSAEKELLIPAGTKFIGETLPFNYNSDVLYFNFHTMILPNGRHIKMSKRTVNMTPTGRGGNATEVDRHYLQQIVQAGILGVLRGYTYPGYYLSPYYYHPFGDPRMPDSKERYKRETLSSVGKELERIIRQRNFSKLTIRIKAGTRIKLFFPEKFVF